jgi:hypothetical protein
VSDPGSRTWRRPRERPFWLEFDDQTLELIRLRPADRHGRLLLSSGDAPAREQALTRYVDAEDEASLRLNHSFKSIALVLEAERAARRRLFQEEIDRLPDPQERRLLQFCFSHPNRTREEAAAEIGCDVELVGVALSHLFREVGLRMSSGADFVFLGRP